MIKTLKSPWKNELLDLASRSDNSIKITSPFIKDNICSDLLNAKGSETKIHLITSFKIGNIYNGSLDIAALEKIIGNKGIVSNFPRLHSKIYIFDDREIIITSGNLTNGGLINNFEYGIYSNDPILVSEVVSDFNVISANENTGTVKQKDLNKVKEIISKLPKSETPVLPQFEMDSPEEIFQIVELDNTIITSSLKGWKLEVFKCADSIPNQIFTLAEINNYGPYLRKTYPTNNHITDKIRQQLQYLRDLGLLEFLGNGKYKKLWK